MLMSEINVSLYSLSVSIVIGLALAFYLAYQNTHWFTILVLGFTITMISLIVLYSGITVTTEIVVVVGPAPSGPPVPPSSTAIAIGVPRPRL